MEKYLYFKNYSWATSDNLILKYFMCSLEYICESLEFFAHATQNSPDSQPLSCSIYYLMSWVYDYVLECYDSIKQLSKFLNTSTAFPYLSHDSSAVNTSDWQHLQNALCGVLIYPSLSGLKPITPNSSKLKFYTYIFKFIHLLFSYLLTSCFIWSLDTT